MSGTMMTLYAKPLDKQR